MFQVQDPLTHTKYMKDGKEIPASLEPTVDLYGNVSDSSGNSLGSTLPTGSFVPGLQGTLDSAVQVIRTPDPVAYITLGHVLWTLLLGYLGGKFAVGFQRFQDNQETSQPPIG